MQPDLPETAYSAFLGDRIRVFCLTAPMIIELERLTGHGIGAIFERLVARHYSHSELVETIRLALIGGGCDPFEASPLIDAYVIGRPFTETYALALSIFETLWFGNRGNNEGARND